MLTFAFSVASFPIAIEMLAVPLPPLPDGTHNANQDSLAVAGVGINVGLGWFRVKIGRAHV